MPTFVPDSSDAVVCSNPVVDLSNTAIAEPSTHVLEQDISRKWLAYFQDNRHNLRPIPWEETYLLTESEKAIITASIQKFQLGESSEGSHLMQTARHYAGQTADPHLVETVKLFIGEEQRHARDLGRFMNQQAIPLARQDWTDTIFRKLRRLSNLETAIMVLLAAELVATVYYKALGNATRSPVLHQICQQILHDEQQHVRFQSEMLGLMRRTRSPWQILILQTAYSLFFAAILLIVWCDHHSTFRAGGYTFSSFYRQAWLALQQAIQLMNLPSNLEL